MKVAIISFILYVIYDTYMRSRENEKFITRTEFDKWKADSASARAASVDLSGIMSRLQTLETSPYA
ncbi:MAG TPA: hypothetical protein VGN64_18300 [Dyadobacter sp.]|jgi:hypothetical protein|nr:hypothetical protein [Dyadobacter sp.]